MIRLDVIILLIGRHITLFTGSGRNYGQPDDSLARPVFLELLHVAAVVVFLGEWASLVGPLKDDELALVLREAVLLAMAIGQR